MPFAPRRRPQLRILTVPSTAGASDLHKESYKFEQGNFDTSHLFRSGFSDPRWM